MARCDECNYWDNSQNTDEYSERFMRTLGRCTKAVEVWNATEWTEPDYDRALKAEYKDQKLFVNDGSSYHAEMQTTGDFFCAHHEAKAKAASPVKG